MLCYARFQYNDSVFKYFLYFISDVFVKTLIINLFVIQLKMFSKLLLGGVVASTFFLQDQQKKQCCGIVGVVSKSETVESVISNKSSLAPQKISIQTLLCNGVQLLKNRGYDSAGIVSFAKKGANTQRLLGKYSDGTQNLQPKNCIERLIQKFTKDAINSTIGIAHTRWATCGQVNDRNSHPHYDQDETIFLVHNGIINNHAQIKAKHLNGVTFRSQTDTEVVAQLIGKFKKQGLSPIQALKKMEGYFNQESKWAIVLIDKDNIDKMYTSTNEQPILIGFSPNQEQIFVASEKIAFQQHANFFFETMDKQIWELSPQKIPEMKNKLQKQGRLQSINNQIEVLKSPPKPFQRFYDYQIRQQGKIKYNPDFQKLKEIEFGDYLSMIACGSSYYAAMSTVHFFKSLGCFKKVNVYDPVDLQSSDITQNQAVVLISQSGETKDLINIVGECKKMKKVKTVGIINVEGSTLARKVDYPIYIKVGRQVSVAATKSFFHQVLNLMEYSTLVAEKKKSADVKILKQIRDNLLLTPQKAEQTMQMVESQCKQLAQIIHKKQSVYFLALREVLAIAKQSALKMKQLNYIHAEAMGACQMKHGPIALIASDKPQQTVVVLFILDNGTFELLMNTLDQMHSRKAYVVVVTDCQQKIQAVFEQQTLKNPDFKKKYHFLIQIPKLSYISHLLAVIPMQILVQQIAILKGINPDMPRNLAKTVTV